MGKCTNNCKISADATVGQAVHVNGQLCDETTIWNISAYGGESVVTTFTLENRSSHGFSISWDISTATDSEWNAGVYESDGTTTVSSPTWVAASTTKDWKFKIDFDKYITEGNYEIVLTFDFAP